MNSYFIIWDYLRSEREHCTYSIWREHWNRLKMIFTWNSTLHLNYLSFFSLFFFIPVSQESGHHTLRDNNLNLPNIPLHRSHCLPILNLSIFDWKLSALNHDMHRIYIYSTRHVHSPTFYYLSIQIQLSFITFISFKWCDRNEERKIQSADQDQMDFIIRWTVKIYNHISQRLINVFSKIQSNADQSKKCCSVFHHIVTRDSAITRNIWFPILNLFFLSLIIKNLINLIDMAHTWIDYRIARWYDRWSSIDKQSIVSSGERQSWVRPSLRGMYFPS